MDEHTGVEHPKKPKQVIVMRKDLGMRKGKMVAQGAHASLKVIFQQIYTFNLGKDGSIEIYPEHGGPLEAWINGLFAKICVGVETEFELLKIYNEAFNAKLPCALILDSGLTEFGGVKTHTCCCIGPAWSEDIDKITGHLKLL